MTKPKYYVVWKGRKTGIFDTWAECEAQVKGYPGARYQSFDTRAQASQAFAAGAPPARHAAREHLPKMERYAAPAQKSGARRPSKKGGPILLSISVDAACSGNPGPLEYRAVNTETGQELFHAGPFQNGTNNVGEFLAIVGALQLCAEERWSFPIYSDSENARLWVKAKEARTKLVRDRRNARLFELIAAAERWLQTHHYSNPILKWDTEAWGENPADFGRK